MPRGRAARRPARAPPERPAPRRARGATASRRSRWSSCRASRARSRWTRSRSQATLAGLQGGADRRGGAAAHPPDAHHRGGHARAGEGVRHRRRRRGAAGDRHRAPARRGRLRVRRAPGGEGAGAVARRDLRARSRRSRAEGAGGYAKELGEAEQRARARARSRAHVSDMDLVVTTAQIPGRPAPRLITADMVRSMRPGSVIVDLAAETGGNCELTRAGETVVEARRAHPRPGEPAGHRPVPREPDVRPEHRDAARSTSRRTARSTSTPTTRSPGAMIVVHDGTGPPLAGTVPCLGSSSSRSTSSCWPASSASWSSRASRRCSTRRSCRRRTPSAPSRSSARSSRPARTASRVATILGFIAVTCATINVVGGFLITDRMLKMFKRGAERRRGAKVSRPATLVHRRPRYLAASVLFILGLRSLTQPGQGAARHAARRARHAARDRRHAPQPRDRRATSWIVAGLVLGVVIGYPLGMYVPMTAMPQRIAISHMFGALAATLVGVAEYYAPRQRRGGRRRAA